MTVTVCIEDEQGKQHEHEVSDEFMELCFERAKAVSLEVVDLVKEMTAEQWYDTVIARAGENANEVQQTIIVNMVNTILNRCVDRMMFKKILDIIGK